jgi:hypothetical protein
MRKLASIVAIALGVVCLILAAGVRWVAAPHFAVLPSDTNTTRTYTGTAATLLNAAALESTSAGPVLIQNAPISLVHTTKVLKTKGSNALVSDAGTLKVSGKALAGFDYRYAVDRTSMGAGSGFDGVVKQTGITFNWPIRTQKHDYPGWVSDTNTAIPLKYTGTAKHGGLSTLVYTTTMKPTLVTDPQTLKELPAALPKATIAQLAGSLGLPAAQLGALQQVLPTLADPVPFSYTYQVDATYWIEPATGIIVDLQEHEVRTLALKVGSDLVPITPVMDISYTSSPTELAASVKDARHKADLVNLAYKTLPLILLVAGIVLLLGGLILAAVRTNRPRHPVVTKSDRTPAGV